MQFFLRVVFFGVIFLAYSYQLATKLRKQNRLQSSSWKHSSKHWKVSQPKNRAKR